MFMDRLLREAQSLADIFTAVEALRLADEHGNPRGWASPCGMLEITRCCSVISDLALSIAKTGYCECDKEILDDIVSETRQVLYSMTAHFAA
jgi:hypothetical protein